MAMDAATMQSKQREDGPEEVNLFVTGFIESKKTALFHNNSQALDPERASFQKQTVNLTGFGTSLFGQSTQRLHELITLFERSYPEHGVETWDLPTAIIQASNRYFTRASDIDGKAGNRWNNRKLTLTIEEDMSQ
ncbi:hypothetical protein C8J56DRAFT_899235 [Mycena floridula]|nr:hypothetical protein C8J56DRAFT_899235 [Mycena floridula]